MHIKSDDRDVKLCGIFFTNAEKVYFEKYLISISGLIIFHTCIIECFPFYVIKKVGNLQTPTDDEWSFARQRQDGCTFITDESQSRTF